MAKENEEKLSLLEQELDDSSAKFLEESLNEWKLSVSEQMLTEFEQVKNQKIEELEEQTLAYREELKSEYAEKLLEALEELKESVRSEITASVIKSNPEIKILEQIKEVVAPLIQEGYRDGAYNDTILTLQAENDELKRKIELTEGAKTLASLVAGYNAPVRNLIVSLMNEGSPDEVTNQFYELLESIEGIFKEAEKEEKAADEEDDWEDEGDKEDKKETKKEKKEEDEDGDEDEDSEPDDEDDDDIKEESYLDTETAGLTEEKKKTNSLRNAILNLTE